MNPYCSADACLQYRVQTRFGKGWCWQHLPPAPARCENPLCVEAQQTLATENDQLRAQLARAKDLITRLTAIGD